MDRRTKDNLRNRVRRAKAKEEAIAYKGGKCEHCGGIYHPAAFDFHHVDPNEKDVDPGALRSRIRNGWEIDKAITTPRREYLIEKA